MKRVLIPVVLLVVVIGVALGYKLEAQRAAQEGPPGGSGVVEATDVDVASKVPGRIVKIAVRKGDAVRQGQLLMEIDCADPEAALAEAEARVDAARAQAAAATAQTTAARRGVSASRAAARSTVERTAALATKQEVATREASRVESLGVHASLSRRDQAQAAASGLQQELEAARTSQVATRQQTAAASAQADAVAAQADAAARAVAAGEAVVARARLLVAECRVTAPRDGTVDDVFYELGELTRPGATLVRLVDLTEVTATFYLPNAELGAVRTGQNARVEADAFPGHSLQGTVITVSAEAEFTPRNIQTRTDRDRLVYAIEVRVPNHDPRALLRPGMPVQVTLLGSTP